MKYTFMGFQQEKAVKLGLDFVDLAILRWFIDFQATGQMKTKEKDGVLFRWVNYQYVIEQIPLLYITTTNNVGRRFRRLVELGVLITIKSGAQGRTDMYYSTNTTACYELLFEHTPQISPHTPQKTCVHTPQKTCNSSIIDSSINYNIDESPVVSPPDSIVSESIVGEKQASKVVEMCDFFYAEYKQKYGVKYAPSFATDRKHMKALIASIGAEVLREKIRRYFAEPYWFTQKSRSVNSFVKNVNEVTVEVKNKRVCGNCGEELVGTSYTCLSCGWSVPV